MIRSAWRDVRGVLPTLVLYLLVFGVVASAVFVPVGAWAAGLMMRGAGRVAVTNTDMLGFVFSGWGVGFVLLSAALGIALLLARQGGLMLISWGAIGGRRVSAVGALYGVVRRGRRLLELGVIATVAYGLVALPFLGAGGLLYWALLSEHDINYYLAEQPAEWWWALGGVAVLVVAWLIPTLLLFVRWSFALPLVMLTGAASFEAMRRSWALVRGRFWWAVRYRVGWLMGVWAVAIAAAAGVELASGWLVAGLAQLEVWLLLAMALVLAVQASTLFLAGLLAWSGVAFLTSRLLWESLPAAERPAVSGDLSRKGEERRRPRLVVGATVGIGLLTVMHGYLIVDGIEMEDRTAVTAHRGSSRRAPENTLAAIRAAAEDGSDYVEIDVQMTSDGVIVLLHDADLKRVGGVSRLIRETPYAEASRLAVGGWFGPGFDGERLPTLAQAIEACGPRMGMNIELKFDGLSGSDLERAVRETARVIREEGFEDRCVLSSLSREALAVTKGAAPELPRGLIVGTAMGDFTREEADFYSVNVKLIRKPLVLQLRDAGRPLHVWTVNDRGAMWAMLDLGVDNVITDEPAALVALKRERAGMSLVERLAESMRHPWR